MIRQPRAYLVQSRHLRISLLSGLMLLQALLTVSHAQITLDGSIGPRGPLTGPNYRIDANMGQLRGGNLFHSFDQFNVPTGGSATFTGPNTIANIVSRVTGGQPSAIDGVLRSEIAGAHLYLLNPSGVLFGSNASLDISGSFHVSTADYLRFTDGAKFSATLGQASMLAVAEPAAFGFLGHTPAAIAVQGSSLRVPEGQTFSAVGGDLTLVGGPLTTATVPTLGAPGGRLQLASVAAPGEVRFSPLELAADLPMEGLARLGQIELHKMGLVSGDIVLRAGRLTLTGGARISSVTSAGQGGNVLITATESVALVGPNADVLQPTVIEGTSVVISAPTVGLENGAEIQASGRGDVAVTVGRLTLTGGARISSHPRTGGPAGDLTITATDAILLSGHRMTFPPGLEGPIPDVSQISSRFIEQEAGGQERGGRVVILTPSLRMDEGLILADSSGRGGDIEVRVGRLTLTGGAQIGSNSVTGQGGNVLITATESATIFGHNTTAEIPSNARGRDGRAPSGVFSQAVELGNGGRISITTPRLIMAEGSHIAADTGGDGRGGDIHVQVGALSVASGARITSSSGFTQRSILHVGTGQGGRLTIAAEDVASIAGQNSGLLSETQGSGQGGDLTLRARELRLTEGARISATSSGTGDAGRLTLTAREGFRSDRSTVTAQAARASGGEITLTAGSRIQLLDSQLTTSVAGGPETVGGNLTLEAPFVIAEGSQIRATAVAGRGGNISIGARVFLADPASVVSASSDLGIQGTVDIRAPVTTLSGTLAPLPQVFVNIAELLPARCAARFSGGKASSLVLGGRDGLPLEPGGVLPSPLVLEERLVADPAVTGGPPHEPSPARFAFLAAQERALPRLQGNPLARGCPK
jgi:filamentous hemagglutinin family protein